jgi:hypothetical protein
MLTPLLKITLAFYVASVFVWFESVSALDSTEQTTPITVAVLSTITVLGGFIYTWLRDSRNRKWDAQDRERQKRENQEALDRQTTLVKNEIRNSEAAAELSRQQQALKVREALLDQEALIKTQRDLDSEKVEAALEKREVATRPDLDKESAEIQEKIDTRAEEILGEIHRSDERGGADKNK